MLRLLSRAILPPVAALALAAPALASALSGLGVPNGYGSYLAGQQALRDLSTADAAHFFRDAVGADWANPAVTQRAFFAYLANGDIDRAVTTANHLLNLAPGNAFARLAVAASELKDRRYRAAVKELDSVASDDNASAPAALLKAWAMVGDNREADALASLDTIGKGGGLDDFLAFHRALMADVSGDNANALQLIGKAYTANPNQARTVEAYARILGNAGRFDDGLAVIDKFNAQGLGDPIVDVVKAALKAHQRPGLFAANVQSGAAEMFRGFAVLLARDGGSDLAITMLQLGLYLDPHNDILAILIGQILDDANQHAAANSFYANVPASSPLRLTADVRVAQNYDAMGNRTEAITRLTGIVKTDPSNLDALTALAGLLRVDSQFDAASKVYSQAVAIDNGSHPGDWWLYYQRGIAYERGGQWDKAQPDFLKALDLSPDQPSVLNYLGYTWVDKGQNLGQALDMIQKAVKAQPTDGFIVDSLGWAYFKLGRNSDAVATLEQAVQLKPNDPQINDHLGDAYWRVGRKLEAHFQWNVASSLDTDGTLKAGIAKKQASGLDATTAAVTTQ